MKPGGESAEGGNWGSIQLPFSCTAEDTLETCPIRTNTKFDTARNFTHFIQPRDRLIKTDDTSSAAAVTRDGKGASLVHVKRTAEAARSPSTCRSSATCAGRHRHPGRDQRRRQARNSRPRSG